MDRSRNQKKKPPVEEGDRKGHRSGAAAAVEEGARKGQAATSSRRRSPQRAQVRSSSRRSGQDRRGEAVPVRQKPSELSGSVHLTERDEAVQGGESTTYKKAKKKKHRKNSPPQDPDHDMRKLNEIRNHPSLKFEGAYKTHDTGARPAVHHVVFDEWEKISEVAVYSVVDWEPDLVFSSKPDSDWKDFFYHGTNHESVLSILRVGYLTESRKADGGRTKQNYDGVYLSPEAGKSMRYTNPSLGIAAEGYPDSWEWFKFIFVVNCDKTQVIKTFNSSTQFVFPQGACVLRKLLILRSWRKHGGW